MELLDKGSIGIGGYLGYSSHKWDYYWLGLEYTQTLFLVQEVLFHYPLVNKLDTYTGMSAWV